MKKYCIFFFSFCLLLLSCGDKDLYNPEKIREQKDEEYAKAFVNAFGSIPSSQSWDFYMNSLPGTGKASDNVSITSKSQPKDVDFSYWQNYLNPNRKNTTVGTHDYKLTSNGSFFAYAVWYGGWYQYYAEYDFELGIRYNDKDYKLFGGCGKTGPKSSVQSDYKLNPGFGAEVNIPEGESFTFYMKYKTNNVITTRYADNNGYSTLLFSDKIGKNKVMVIGFEDGNDWNYSDVIIYLEGNSELPVPESKRYMCEDLGSIGDFDFNDVVFDICPNGTKTANVIVRAAGGTLPVELEIDGKNLGEVHSILGVGTDTMVNTGESSASAVTKTVTFSSDIDLRTFNNVKLIVTDKDGTKRDIGFSKNGSAPCIIATPISVSWMKEKKNIRTAYPNFFGDGWWKNANADNLYADE